MQKSIFTLFIAILAFKGVSAQGQTPKTYNQPFVLPSLKNPVILKQEKKTAPGTTRARKNYPGTLALQGTLISPSAKGNLYYMSPDQMPVIVPGNEQIPYMPGGQKDRSGKQAEPMPNPYKPPAY